MTIQVVPLYDHADKGRLVSLLISVDNEKDIADLTKGFSGGINCSPDRPPELGKILSILWAAGEGKAEATDEVTRLRVLLQRVTRTATYYRLPTTLVHDIGKELAPKSEAA